MGSAITLERAPGWRPSDEVYRVRADRQVIGYIARDADNPRRWTSRFPRRASATVCSSMAAAIRNLTGK